MLIKLLSYKGVIGAEIEVNEKDIKEFGYTNQKLYNKNGTFKKWWKRGYIKIDNEWLNTYDSTIKELKECFKGKFTTTKHTEIEYKKYSERKATDWMYKINEI